MMRPTCSLLMPLTIVTTGTISTPALCRFSIAFNFTSNKLPTMRWALAALPIRRIADTHSACRLRLPVDRIQNSLRIRFHCRGLHGVVSDFARVANGIEEVGRQRGLAAGELHAHLTTRLDRDRVVEHGLDFFPMQFVTKPTWFASMKQGSHNNVAAVREIRSSAPSRVHTSRLKIRGVQLLVVVAAMSRRGKRLRGASRNRCRSTSLSSKVAWMGQSFTIKIFPSLSTMVALISPIFSFIRTSCGQFAVKNLLADSGHNFGQSESVERGQPSGWPSTSRRTCSGLSDHSEWAKGFADLVQTVKDRPAPFCGDVTAFSTY